MMRTPGCQASTGHDRSRQPGWQFLLVGPPTQGQQIASSPRSVESRDSTELSPDRFSCRNQVTPRSLRLEGGRHKTSVETLQQLAEALCVRFVLGFKSGPREVPTRGLVSVR
jgi:hypothetical protein